MSLRFDYHAAQIIGRRARQEDAFGLALELDYVVACLADGVGGHRDGHLASRLAVDTFIYRSGWLNARNVPHARMMREGVRESHLAVMNLRKPHETESNPPASTLLAMHVDLAQRNLTAAFIGDSRLYRLREGQLEALFEPQAIAGRLSHAVGYDIGYHGNAVQVIEELELLAGDCLIAASDGLCSLSEDQLTAIMYGKRTAKDAIEALFTAIAEIDGKCQDNCSVLYLRLID